MHHYYIPRWGFHREEDADAAVNHFPQNYFIYINDEGNEIFLEQKCTFWECVE